MTRQKLLLHNLPFPLTSFIGREREIAEATRLLADSRLLTLTGAGGCGKSRLALEVVRREAKQFHHGVWLVELAALADGELVPQAVATVLGVPEQLGRSHTDTLLAYLRPKSVLLVLDNCEHLISGCLSWPQRCCRRARTCGSSRPAARPWVF